MTLEEARARLEEGDLERAREALQRALEADPNDSSALVDLGYLALGAGNADEAAGLFRQALEREPGNIDALRAIATIHGRSGRAEDAFEAASAVADAQAEDPLAVLELAELALDLGRLDEASAAFQRLRSVDDDPSHEVYAFHGLIEVELHRESWRRALDLAVDATRVDRAGRTTDILAYVVAQVFGHAPDRPVPERAEVEAALGRSRAEHRRLHLEAW
jgi:tetratricopeptide (TPR) repeat protein